MDACAPSKEGGRREATWYRYAVPLAPPVPLSTGPLAERRGLLVRLRDGAGRCAWGEAAPLPGFSRETLADVEAAAGAGTGEVDGLPASLRFALGQAAADLDAQARGCALPSVLTDDPAAALPVNGLLAGETEAVVAEARTLRDAGYRAVKLKVGRRRIEADAARVRAVRAALGPDVALRLDANRAWTPDEAAAFAGAVAGCGIAYVEEPLVDPAGLPALVEQTGLAVALDETAVDLPVEALARHRYARAVVLKPTLLGWGRTLALGRAARRLGVAPVVSSAFETGVGLRGLVALGAALGAAPAGLDTYHRLAADVLDRPLFARGPEIDVRRLEAAPLRVRLDVLQPL